MRKDEMMKASCEFSLNIFFSYNSIDKREMQFFEGRNYRINKILLSCVGQWPYQTNRSSNAIIIIIVSLAGTQFIAKVWQCNTVKFTIYNHMIIWSKFYQSFFYRNKPSQHYVQNADIRCLEKRLVNKMSQHL